MFTVKTKCSKLLQPKRKNALIHLPGKSEKNNEKCIQLSTKSVETGSILNQDFAMSTPGTTNEHAYGYLGAWDNFKIL